MSSDDPVKEAFEDVKSEFNDFRNSFGHILEVVSEVDQAKAGDNVEALLEKLEDAVHKVRTGGVMHSGINSYSRALKDWHEAQHPKK
jgi:hypothetical protein